MPENIPGPSTIGSKPPAPGPTPPGLAQLSNPQTNPFRDILDQYYGKGTDWNIYRLVGQAQLLQMSRAGHEGMTFVDPKASWDFRTATRNRDGDPLPPGAVGWTPDNQPYYGSGANLGPQAMQTMQGRFGVLAGTNLNDIEEWGKGLANRFRWYNPKTKAYELKHGAAFGGQIIKEAFMGFGEVWSAFITRPIETGLGLEAGVEQAGAGSPLPDVSGAIRQSDVAQGLLRGGVLPHTKTGEWFVNFALGANPILGVYNAARFATSPMSPSEKDKILVGGAGAARIAYSAWSDPAIRQEYIRRYMSGEDPYLLAAELRNPWAELGGQLLLDPTNAFMMAGWIGKFAKVGVTTEEIAKGLGATKEVATAIETLKNAGTEADFINAGEKLVQASIDGTRAALADKVALSRGTNIFLLTPDAARARAAEEGSGLLSMLLAYHRDDPERAIEVVRLLGKKASGDPGEVMSAVGELSRHPYAPYFFSKSGDRLGILMRELNPESLLEKVQAVQDDPEKLLALVKNSMESASGKLYPTITERIAAGEDVPELAKQLDNLVHGKGIIGSSARKINRFFAGIYMGLSPGYAARNATQNYVHMLTDYGPGIFEHSPTAWAEISKSWLGGVASEAMTRQIVTPAATVDLAKSQLPGIRASNLAEKAASQTIHGYVVEQSMRPMLLPGRALPSLDALEKAGLSPEATRFVVGQILANYGDTDKAAESIRAAMAVGSADNFRAMEFLRPSEIRFAQQMPAGGGSLYDRLVQALRTPKTEEEAQAAVAEIFSAFDKEAARAGRAGIVFDGEELAARPLDSAMVIATANKAGIPTTEAQELVAIREFVGQRAMNKANEVVGSELGRIIPAIQNSGGDTRIATTLAQEGVTLHTRISGRLQGLRQASAALTEQAIAGYRNVEVGSKEAGAIWEPWAAEMSDLYRNAHAMTLEDIAQYLDNVAAGIPGYDTGNLSRVVDDLHQAGLWDNATIEGNRFVSGSVDLARPYTGATPSQAQFFAETAATRNAFRESVTRGLTEHWGEKIAVTPADEAVTAYLNEARDGIAQARLLAKKTADSARDFTLLNYANRRGIDTLMGMIYPYQYWYSRTYINWMRRFAQHPEIAAAYFKYRKALEQAHSDAPEWWRYNINTNELLGLNSENPFYFNLESTLNPLNGMTGVDFNNPDRRAGWFANTVDDLGKFGPSVWTPVSLAIAVGLYSKGEKDAAAAWGGRLIPQTATLKAGLSLLRGKVSDLPLQGEYDPAVQFFSGGMDTYERRRVARALGGMIQDGTIDKDQAEEAARTRSGPYWNEAMDRAANQRAPGQLASFLAGVGFRPRTPADIQTDQFFADYHRLLAMKSDLSPDEWRKSWDNLRSAYPFMDAMLLGRRNDAERDSAFVYNVTSRIPPSHQDDYAKLAGISPDLLTKFYDTKGDMSSWPEGDRMRFMAGMIDLGAILQSPDDATRGEWTNARIAYDRVYQRGKGKFGSDIWDRVDAYLGAKGPTDNEKATAEGILNSDPQIGQALDYKSAEVLRDPLLFRYYASLGTIEGYYKGQMWGAIEKKLGSDIWDKWDEYFSKDGADRRAYWNAHPELRQYGRMKDAYDPIISAAIVRVADKLRDVSPEIRRQELSPFQQQLAGGIQQPPGFQQMSWDQWQGVLGESLSRLVQDYNIGQPLPAAALRRMKGVADDLGLDSAYIALGLAQEALKGQYAVP